MYVWTVEKKWSLQVNPRIVPSGEESENKRRFFRNYLKETIGANYGGEWGYLGDVAQLLFYFLVQQFNSRNRD